MLKQTSNILDRLAAADREHQKEAGARLLLRSFTLLCAFILAAFLADLILHLPARWRLALLILLAAGALVLTVSAAYLAYIRRNRLERIARFLETREPALGSRLINFLQLRTQSEDATVPPLTRDLACRAVEEYAAAIDMVPLERLARTGQLRRYWRQAAWTFLAFAALLGAFFRISMVELVRFADPFGDHPPYSFTRLEIVQPGPAGTNVLYGKGLIVKARAFGHQPRDVFITAYPPEDPARKLTVAMFHKREAGFDQLLDNIKTDLILFAHTADGVSRSKQTRVGVLLAPQLEHAFVRVAPPAYTGVKPEEKPYAFKGLQVLAGSEVRFRIQSNRPLRNGSLEITSEEPPERIVLTNSAETEVSGCFVAGHSGRLRLSITDIAGLTSSGDAEGALTVTHDLPPEIRLAEPDRDAFAAMDLQLKAHIEASDDYGLRAVRLHRGLNGVYSPPQTVTYDTLLRDSHQTADFNFAGLGIAPGDVISLFAEAIDTAPQPHLARSQTVRLLVISIEEYNEFLRQQTDLADTAAKYAELNDDLQELVDDQKQLGDRARNLRDEIARADDQQREALLQQLDTLIAEQNELNHKLDRHADRREAFVRDHPLYDVERELQELLRTEAARIRQSTATNAAASRDIARRSAPPAGARQITPDMPADLAQAADEQAARLGGVRDDTERAVVQRLEEMSRMQELQKDFAQFQSLYRAQQELAAQSQPYNRPGQLDREDQLALKELAGLQKQVGDQLRALEQKLREHADAAETLFPKAARSGRDLADKIQELRLPPLADQATGHMLAGNGEQSFQLADRLRGEMEKLFSDCQGGNCPSGNELDEYLRLQRMNPGNNFAQMGRSRKFGQAGAPGSQGMGMGEGQAGTSGYAVVDGSTISVLGNEMAPRDSSTRTRPSASRLGRGSGSFAGNATGSPENPDTVRNLNPINRQSGAVAGESVIEEYHAVVENYFRAITTSKKQQP